MDMSLWDMVERYCRETGAKEAAIMRRANLNKGTFTAWRARGIPALPARGQLLDLAAALRVDYEALVMAILRDTKYLPEQAARAEQQRLDEEHEAELRDFWARVDAIITDLYEESGGDRATALKLYDSMEQGAEDRHAWSNVRSYFYGLLEYPPWLSDPWRRTDDLRAAHEEEGSISGEQESPTEP